jgi:hypothetical protein
MMGSKDGVRLIGKDPEGSGRCLIKVLYRCLPIGAEEKQRKTSIRIDSALAEVQI